MCTHEGECVECTLGESVDISEGERVLEQSQVPEGRGEGRKAAAIGLPHPVPSVALPRSAEKHKQNYGCGLSPYSIVLLGWPPTPNPRAWPLHFRPLWQTAPL